VSVRLPRCLLFDMDGTLLDSLPGIVYSVQAAFTAAGLPERAFDLRQLIGPPIRTILSRAAETDDPALLDALERHFRASYDSEGWRQSVCFPDALEVLQAMKKSAHRLFIVTNKPRHSSAMAIEADGLTPFFERIYTRDSKEPPYISKADMLQALLADQHLSPQECVMVGDTMEDAGAAAMHKINFIFMEHGYGEISSAHPVMLRLGKLSEFLPYLAMENVR
jgi:phosphoglycolate phosphatase